MPDIDHRAFGLTDGEAKAAEAFASMSPAQLEYAYTLMARRSAIEAAKRHASAILSGSPDELERLCDDDYAAMTAAFNDAYDGTRPEDVLWEEIVRSYVASGAPRGRGGEPRP